VSFWENQFFLQNFTSIKSIKNFFCPLPSPPPLTEKPGVDNLAAASFGPTWCLAYSEFRYLESFGYPLKEGFEFVSFEPQETVFMS
jgi:hypothetical protein